MDKSIAKPSAGKPIRCRGAVARAAGEPLVIEQVIVAPPKSGEVRIKIICSSLCYSDITCLNLKEPPGCFPRIMGHEAVGIIESVGEGVTEFAEGDTVIPIFMADCTECADCISSKSNLCSKFPFQVSPWLHDGTSRFTDLKGETLFHFLFVSSFIEYTVVHIANVTKVDPAIPANRACLLSCGVSTGVGAALRTANVEAGSTVAIFGLGSIGLAVRTFILLLWDNITATPHRVWYSYINIRDKSNLPPEFKSNAKNPDTCSNPMVKKRLREQSAYLSIVQGASCQK